MSKFHQIISYFDYWLNAVDKHSLQAPYIYELYQNVLANPKSHPDFSLIEQIRGKLQQSGHTIPVVDFGAGSLVSRGTERRVRDIAKKGITRRKYSQLMYNLSEYLRAKNIVELGTSLGINTLYLSLSSAANVFTFEGSPSLCNIAGEIFDDLKRNNIRVIQGDIDKVLPGFMRTSTPIDLAFIDANHRYDPTMSYFNLFSDKVHQGSCLVFDDIHWSKEMEKAWREIKDHYTVTLSIDLYQMGLVFFNPDLRKQHYVLEF